MDHGSAVSPEHLSIEEIMASCSENTIKAHKFEESYRAHGSVSGDEFYQVPKSAVNASPGALLKLEKETNTSLYTIPPNLALSRFIYQSKTSYDSLVPVSAYVLWPYVARPYHDGYPVVAWAHGTSGTTTECPPSNIRNLWHHFQGPYQLALNGYVVVATDYAGLGVGRDASGKQIIHEYITGPAQANDVLYSLQAAREAFPELSRDFVLMGTSLGGGGAWAFAQKLAVEPVAGHLGTIALHPVTRLLSLPLDEPVIPFLLIFLAASLVAKYPEFKPEDIFHKEGKQSLDTYLALKGCNTVLFQLPSGPEIVKPGWQNNPYIQKYQEVAANGGKKISGPLLVIQGEDDPLICAESVTDAVNETMKMFPSSQIEYYLLPHVRHAPAMYASQHIWMDWIAARFAGEPAKPGSHSHVCEPVRPASAQQVDTNWFIELETEPWQKT